MLLLVIFYIVVVVGFAIDALIREENPHKALCHLAAIVALPLLGIVLYLLDGRRSREPEHPVAEGRGRIPRLVESMCGEPVTYKNSVELLHNADKTYAALIRDIRRSSRSVYLQYYIFIDDRLGRVLCDILERKARNGVRVCIIYDAIGSWSLRRRTIVRLRRAGVEIRPFKPFRFPWFRSGVARRNHRKIAIIDSRIAFTGGINIAKRYIDGDYLGRWRDEHLRIRGDSVYRLQQIFARDWALCGGGSEQTLQARPKHSVTEYLPMQIAANDEFLSQRALLDLFTALVAGAERVVRISTPYFIPPEGLLDAIRIALASGVRVEVMVPERGDSRLVALVSESFLRRIERAGARVYRYENGFLHSKVVLVDDRIASLGTANIDYRSLCENLEVTALIYDSGVVGSLTEQFDRDKAFCRQGGDERRCRGAISRLGEALLRVLSPLL